MNSKPEAPRYYALDSVRATAMLLGVVYHSMIFRMFIGGRPSGPMGGGASRHLQDWLHSFRMPLFFLISGFFGRMMLEKYGTKLYFKKRWSRIGIPLIIGCFTFGPIYVLARQAVSDGGPPDAERLDRAPCFQLGVRRQGWGRLELRRLRPVSFRRP